MDITKGRVTELEDTPLETSQSKTLTEKKRVGVGKQQNVQELWDDCKKVQRVHRIPEEKGAEKRVQVIMAESVPKFTAGNKP